jgi:hypothetical protein
MLARVRKLSFPTEFSYIRFSEKLLSIGVRTIHLVYFKLYFFIITKVFKNLTGQDMTSIDACTGRKAGLRIHHQTFPRVRPSAWLK